MACLSSKVKAYLISKGKTELEVKELLGSQTSIILEADSSGESIKTWDVSGITTDSYKHLTHPKKA